MLDILDYDSLVAEFEHGLINRLRGHGISKDFLELWVPDEDPVKGLLSMIEAAEAQGQNRLTIDIDAAHFSASEIAQLRTYLGAAAILKDELVGNKVRLSYSSAASINPEAITDIAACFRAAVAARLGALVFVGRLESGTAETLVVAATHDDGALAFSVDTATQTVVQARHEQARTPTLSAILDVVCSLAEGRPIQEVHDHVLTKAIEYMTDRSMAPPVPGIRLPINVDPAFLPVGAIIRAVYAAYEEATGFAAGINFFDEPPTPGWLALSNEERLARVVAELQGFLTEKGLPVDEVAVTGIIANRFKHPVRIFIQFRGTLPAQEKPGLMRAFERRLKQNVESHLHIYNETAKDESQLRRL